MTMKNLLSALIVSGLVLTGVGQVNAAQGKPISEADIIQAQEVWGEAIVAIGEAYTSQQDYEALAEEVIDNLYGYDEGTVLFKPTKAAEEQFRSTKEEALSYFVTGIVPEDHGFAIQPWSDVRFENDGIIIEEDSALAMGNYYFTDASSGDEVKVEFTFGYFQDEDGDLRIRLHHSSLPYQPQH